MFTFEEFKRLNGLRWSEEDMQKNYQIALKVEQAYYEKFGTAKEPKVGDIIEYTDGYQVYTQGKIVENLYCKEGEVCVCDAGSSFTTGDYFSTSGGSFNSKEKALMQYVGEAENIVWTWGCYGAGADQGINIPIKVNRWIIPYDPKAVKRSTVRFSTDSVYIENNDDCMFKVMSFNSRRAFEAWSRYVGYEYHMEGEVAYSPQKVVTKCWTSDDNKPTNGKPIKVLGNARVHDGLVVTGDFCITQYWPNIYKPEQKYGTPEYNQQMEAYWRYHENPMGV